MAAKYQLITELYRRTGTFVETDSIKTKNI